MKTLKLPTENKFTYTPLERIDGENGRQYKVKDGVYYDSVTTILSRTKSEEDKKGLQAWRDKVGDEEADRIMNDASGNGTVMHQYLEDMLEGKLIQQDEKHPQAIIQASIIYRCLHNCVEKVYASEAFLHSPKYKYAGATDLIAQIEGRLCIADFKQANRYKKEEHMQDYFIQCAMYANAHNELYPDSPINTAVIFLCNRTDYQLQVKALPDLSQFEDEMIRRIERHHREYRDLDAPPKEEEYGYGSILKGIASCNDAIKELEEDNSF